MSFAVCSPLANEIYGPSIGARTLGLAPAAPEASDVAAPAATPADRVETLSQTLWQPAVNETAVDPGPAGTQSTTAAPEVTLAQVEALVARLERDDMPHPRDVALALMHANRLGEPGAAAAARIRDLTVAFLAGQKDSRQSFFLREMARTSPATAGYMAASFVASPTIEDADDLLQSLIVYGPANGALLADPAEFFGGFALRATESAPVLEAVMGPDASNRVVVHYGTALLASGTLDAAKREAMTERISAALRDAYVWSNVGTGVAAATIAAAPFTGAIGYAAGIMGVALLRGAAEAPQRTLKGIHKQIDRYPEAAGHLVARAMHEVPNINRDNLLSTFVRRQPPNPVFSATLVRSSLALDADDPATLERALLEGMVVHDFEASAYAHLVAAAFGQLTEGEKSEQIARISSRLEGFRANDLVGGLLSTPDLVRELVALQPALRAKLLDATGFVLRGRLEKVLEAES